MASFAAIGYRLPTGSSGSYYSAPLSNNNRRRLIQRRQQINAARLKYKNVKNKYFAANNAVRKQKRNVSGGLIGYIKRRIPGNIGQKARNNRNSKLNGNLKKRLNNAKNVYNKA